MAQAINSSRATLSAAKGSRGISLLATALIVACGGDHSPTAPIVTPPNTGVGVSYAGFDIANYPGTAALQAWKYPASPFRWVGYYLPAPCHRDESWSGKLSTLNSLGWGVAAIYVGQQDWSNMLGDLVSTESQVTCSASLLSSAQGAAEAADAVAKLRADGFPDGTTVFLDIEPVSPVSKQLLDYYSAWVAGVLSDGHYKPGVYAVKSNASTLYDVAIADLHGARYTPPFWIASSAGFSMDRKPADVGLSFAQLWQGVFNVAQTFNGVTLTIDVNVASKSSPSAP